jgi:hypothetical protein
VVTKGLRGKGIWNFGGFRNTFDNFGNLVIRFYFCCQ